jgi:hypothetical protein
MKTFLNNPIMVNLEIGLVEDIIKIIGSAIHNKFSHDEIEGVKKVLISKGQEAIQKAQQEPAIHVGSEN